MSSLEENDDGCQLWGMDLRPRVAQRGGDYFRMVKIESKSESPILDEAKSFAISLLGNSPDFDEAKSNILDFDSILTAPK